MFSRPWPKRQFANSLGEKNYENEWCFSFFTPAIYFLIYYDYVRKRLATVTVASLSLSYSRFLLSFSFKKDGGGAGCGQATQPVGGYGLFKKKKPGAGTYSFFFPTFLLETRNI